MPRLFVDITSHGFGHVAQVAPVLNRLAQQHPTFELIVHSTVDPALLSHRLHMDFRHIAEASDIGMIMTSALTVDVRASALAYQHFHQHWHKKISQAARTLERLAPDLVLVNAPYLSLAAAAEVGIPAVALSSLNWADIYQHFCVHDGISKKIHGQMFDAYQAAQMFLRTEPAMPMPRLHNTRALGPIATLGLNRRMAIVDKLQLQPTTRLVLLNLGGIPQNLDLRRWPIHPDIHWLVPKAWQVPRPDMSGWQELGFPFIDVLHSCDAVLTKPGYGMFTEAACNGVPVLYVPRTDWPEEPYLVDWLSRLGRTLAITQQQLHEGLCADALTALLSTPPPSAVVPTGIHEACMIINAML